MQGAMLFSAVITGQQWTYICLSMCGGFLYSYSKFKLKQAENKAGAGVLPLSRQK
jgi:sulfite exporter TauE/SafE|eukprot:COSAG01_NODE_1896_length_8969_cov_35.725028_10_plen_55_part_00